MNIIYDDLYFIDKFDKGPELITRHLTDFTGAHCALDQLGSLSDDNYERANLESQALADLFIANLNQEGALYNHCNRMEYLEGQRRYSARIVVVALINDDKANRYIEGSTAKERILNALKKIKRNEKI